MPKLTTQTRLIALLCLVVAAFVGAYLTLHRAQNTEAARMLAELQADRSVLLDDILSLTGESLENLTNDYSNWDEMVRFVSTADRPWAEDNIDVSLPLFRANGAWVLAPDGTQIHGAVLDIDASYSRLPLAAQPLLAKLQDDPFAHFYATTTAGLLEFRAAPIQPTNDSERTSPARGWLVTARLWDDTHLAKLQRPLGGLVTLDEPQEAATSTRDALLVRVVRELPDSQGKPVALLRSDFHPQPLALLKQDNQKDRVLLIALAGMVVLGLTVALPRWVLRPLHLLETSLETQSAAPLEHLRHSPDIFGRLARLTSASFEQRRALEDEIEERSRAEAALRESQQALVNSTELRSRLARDLHDGVIQSIYAAGLGLEGLRTVLRSDPEAAERRIDAAQSSLNQTIREVRGFIQGLEPENPPQPDFAHALQILISPLRALHVVDIRCQLGLAPHRLSPQEEIHALQIIRESASNAIRHGLASKVTVSLNETPSGPALCIEDNGRGFDPTAPAPSDGNGLKNIAARAAEISARFEMHSAPGNGTRISLHFPQR